MCVSMLVGTTFAWFTDTASTGVNKIQAGTLDVALEMKDNRGNWVGAEGETLQFKVNGQIPAAGTQILWEPGCTYELPELRVVNKGNLALKYKIAISGIQGDAELNNAIEWTITNTSATTALNEDHPLAAGASDTLTISGHMKESAGNEYQGKSIDGIGITVVATQDTVEHDSNGNTYDERAEYPVLASSVSDFRDALSQGNSTIILASDVTVEDGIQMSVENDASINFNGNTLKGAVESGSISSSDGPTNLVLSDPNNSGEYSIDGEIVLHTGGGMTQFAAIDVYKPTVTIESGKYTHNNAVINCQLQTSDPSAVGVVVNGGTFDGKENADVVTDVIGRVVINGGTFNAVDRIFYVEVNTGYTQKIVVNGGTFNVDPSEYVDTANYNVTHSGSTWTVTAK